MRHIYLVISINPRRVNKLKIKLSLKNVIRRKNFNFLNNLKSLTIDSFAITGTDTC